MAHHWVASLHRFLSTLISSYAINAFHTPCADNILQIDWKNAIYVEFTTSWLRGHNFVITIMQNFKSLLVPWNKLKIFGCPYKGGSFIDMLVTMIYIQKLSWRGLVSLACRTVGSFICKEDKNATFKGKWSRLPIILH